MHAMMRGAFGRAQTLHQALRRQRPRQWEYASRVERQRATCAIADFCQQAGLGEEPKNPPTRFERFAGDFNETIAKNPLVLFWFFMGSRTGTWFALYKVSAALNLFPGPELALGFLVSRVTSKFRQPVNIALAAACASAFPQLSLLKVSVLLTGMVPGKKGLKEGLKGYATSDTGKRVLDGVMSGLKFIQGPIDKYGASWYISSKITTMATILGGAYAIKSGMDVTSVLSEWGFDTDLQDGFGAMAGAFFINTPLVPLHLVLAVSATKEMGPRVTAWMEEQDAKEAEAVAKEEAEREEAERTWEAAERKAKSKQATKRE
jgi:hypothetical protein